MKEGGGGRLFVLRMVTGTVHAHFKPVQTDLMVHGVPQAMYVDIILRLARGWVS